MEYDPQHAGRQIKCPACHHKIAIPKGPEHKNQSPVSGEEHTWTKDLATPEVSTPTRYAAPEKNTAPKKPST